MVCLQCNGEKFKVKKVITQSRVRGEKVAIKSPAHVCAHCGFVLMNVEQMRDLRKLGADTYRKKHHLLTSQQIIAYRKKMGMTQVEFAHYLHVGEASVKRWETYWVQDPVQDEHIRIKCDKKYAEKNLKEIERLVSHNTGFEMAFA